MSYADLPAFKAYLTLPADDTSDDVPLQRDLDVAAASIDHLCSRTFTIAAESPDPKTDWLDVPHWDTGERAWVMSVPDLFEVASLEVFTYNEATLAWDTAVVLGVNPYRPMNAPPGPYNAIILPPGAYAWSALYPDTVRPPVKASAYFGWAAYPDAVVQANLIQAARLYKRREATFGIVGSPDGSAQTRLLDRIDADAVVMLRGYIKYWAAG